MPVYLLITTAVIILCIVLNKISSRLGIPMLLAFILLGMLFGSDGIFRIPFDNFDFSEKICTLALIFIIFYGGFGTKWSEARPVALHATLLSTLGVLLTAGLTGLFCHLSLKIDWLEGLLIGAIVSSTDAASVFSILRSRRLNLKYGTASLLELESGSNDPCSYLLTVVLLSLMGDPSHGGGLPYMIFAQFAYGILFGAGIAAAALWVLRHFTFEPRSFDMIFVFAVALLAYAAPAAVGGNGYLSVYLVGLVLGNRPVRNKRALVHFFDGITDLMQMLIFFLLGLLSFPSSMPRVIGPAALIFVFLTLVARPAAVFLILTPLRCKPRQQLLVAFSGLRGAASIAFAVVASVSPAAIGSDVFHIVFCVVLFSILIQGSLLAPAAKKLGMIDERADVLKTFSDYTEEVPVRFIQFTITESHPWAGKAVRRIVLPPEALLVLLQRGGERLTPNGDTVLLPGDILVLSARAPGIVDGVSLSEMELHDGNAWIGRTIGELPSDPDMLIVMIRRSGKLVFPNGGTRLLPEDTLVINRTGGGQDS